MTLTSEFQEWMEEQAEWRATSVRPWAFVMGLGTWVISWLDTLAGALAAVLSILTGGCFEEINQLAALHLREADRLGKSLYELLIGVTIGKTEFEPSIYLLEPVREVASTWADELWPRRVGYAFSVTIDVVTNFIDLLLGLAAAIVSLFLIPLERGEPVINFARHNLGPGKLISDLMLGLVRVVNPSAKGLQRR
jgi:hypothetical protein